MKTWQDQLGRKRKFIDLKPMQNLKLEGKSAGSGFLVDSILSRYEFNQGIHHNDDFKMKYLEWRFLGIAIENACKNGIEAYLQEFECNFKGVEQMSELLQTKYRFSLECCECGLVVNYEIDADNFKQYDAIRKIKDGKSTITEFCATCEKDTSFSVIACGGSID